jgi:hypothetical protein
MQFRTEELLERAQTLPQDEYSVNNAEREFADESAARSYFDDLKARLVDIVSWNENSDVSSYVLFDESGRSADDGRIRRGRFMQITLPGTGKGDWVRVEDVFESPDEIVITVKPTYDPTEDPPQTGKTSHFFWAGARNNFCALRDSEKVMVYVIGLNEKLNSNHTSGILEKVRNTAVANLGYYLGAQKAVWKAFCERFVSAEPANK